jgi:azurin
VKLMEGHGTGLTRREFMVVIAAGSVLTACTGSAPPAAPADAATTTSTGPDPDETGTATADAGASLTDAPGVVSVEIGTATGPQEFRYDKTALSVPTGTKVKLTFTNNTDSKDEVGHNWVLVEPGQEAAVVASGQAAGDTADWLRTDDPAVLAHTRLIEGGQSNTIRFTAPAKGTYSYLCTYPDHYAGGQKGTLTVA